ncbi:MAG TPA: ATP-binding protein [Puia sp.]|nr:ATP-binding protein [Puia sp.]
MIPKLHNRVGPPVEGTDFFGREKEIAETWNDLVDNNHLLITAPRRIGKSSLVKKLIPKARDSGWKAAYVDVQGVTDEIDFFKTFIETLNLETETWFSKVKDKALTSFNELLNKIELELKTESGGVKVKWTGTQSAAINGKLKELLSGTDDFLIVIDELPFFLARIEKEEDGRKRVSDFLHLLRSYRQKSNNKIRWIFCGSIGLDSFTEKHNLSESFNDVLAYSIGAFDEITARKFLQKLGKDNDLPLSETNIDKILSKMGWPLPYFLQAHFKQLNRLKADGNRNVITDEDIEIAYSNILQHTQALRTWEERLDEQLSPDDAFYCKAILTKLCKNNKGFSRRPLFTILYQRINDTDKCETKLNFCLRLLDRDGYILFHDSSYSFRSPLLRDYWYNLKVR